MAACAELSALYRLIEPLQGRGGTHHHARYFRGDRRIVPSRDAPCVSGFAGSFGPTMIRRRLRSSNVPIAVPGATVGPLETRVSWAGLPQPSNAPQEFLLRTRRSAWRASRGMFPREGLFARPSISAKDQTIGLEAPRGTSASRRPLLEDLQALARLRAALGRFFLERGQRLQNLDEGSGLAGVLHVEANSCAAAERTWALRPPQSDARACA